MEIWSTWPLDDAELALHLGDLGLDAVLGGGEAPGLQVLVLLDQHVHQHVGDVGHPRAVGIFYRHLDDLGVVALLDLDLVFLTGYPRRSEAASSTGWVVSSWM